MGQGAHLRVLVITSESRSISNELWRGAGRHVGEILLVGEQTTEPTWESNYVGLPTLEPTGNLSARILRGLGSVIKRYQPDVVHINNEMWALTVLSNLRTDATVVVHGAENVWHKPSGVQTRIHRAITALALRQIQGYASWNEAGRAWVAARSAIPTLAYPAIIPPAEFRHHVWEPPACDRFRILLVGNLTPLKGFATVLEAITSSRGRERYAVTICGEGPERGALEQFSRRNNLAVNFAGKVSAENLATLMKSSHVLVQPSVDTPELVEQFGRSVAEAMTMGMPCVVSDSGELPRVAGRRDLVFRQNHPGDLAGLLDALVDRPERLRELSAHSRERAKTWEPDKGGGIMADFWASCRQQHVRSDEL